jgi:hypothetical protein
MYHCFFEKGSEGIKATAFVLGKSSRFISRANLLDIYLYDGALVLCVLCVWRDVVALGGI